MATDRNGNKGHWVTLFHRNDHGKEVGAPLHVFIKDKRVKDGHHRLKGKTVKPHSPVEHKRREYERQARKARVNPKDAHALAADFMAHDREAKADFPHIIREAKKIAAASGYGDLRSLTARRETGGKNRNRLDHHHVRGLDVMSHDLAARFPGVLGDNPDEKLFELLTGGAPKPMSEEEAYSKAIDYLQEHHRERYDDVPFSAPMQSVPLGGFVGSDLRLSASDRAEQERMGEQLVRLAGLSRR